MTREANLCGYPNRRCAGCDNAVSRTLDECPSCGGADIGPSTCRNPVKVEGEKCRTHNPGQMAPQVKRKAAERKLESDLRSLLALYDLGECRAPRSMNTKATRFMTTSS